MDISFVILTWNSQSYIVDCLSSYFKTIKESKLNAEFLIVDNGSSDNTISIVESYFNTHEDQQCQGQIYKLSENKGTTIPRNFGLKNAVGEYIIICDSDTVFKEGNLKEAIDYLNMNPDVGMIAPYLFTQDNKVQHSVKLFPTLTNKFNKVRNLFIKKRKLKTDYYWQFPWKHKKPVDTAISAFWLFHRRLLDDVGFLDEKIFYSPEDLDYCVRVWKANKKIIFYPFLKILHITQQITHKKKFSLITLSHLFGLLYYFRKHGYFFSRKKLIKIKVEMENKENLEFQKRQYVKMGVKLKDRPILGIKKNDYMWN
jgi:hypothetical protein